MRGKDHELHSSLSLDCVHSMTATSCFCCHSYSLIQLHTCQDVPNLESNTNFPYIALLMSFITSVRKMARTEELILRSRAISVLTSLCALGPLEVACGRIWKRVETWAREALECCRLSSGSNSGGCVEDNAERQTGNQDDGNRGEGLLAPAQADHRDVKNLQISEV